MHDLMNKVFGVLIIVIIMLVLTPLILSFSNTGAGSELENLSASSKTIVSLLPLFWILAILGIIVGIVIVSFKSKHN